LGRAQIEFRLIYWVAHGAQALAPSTEDIRNRYDWIAVKQLTQNHRVPLGKSLMKPCSIPVATGSPWARQSWTLDSSRCACNPRARSSRTASMASAQYGPRQYATISLLRGSSDRRRLSS